MLTSGLSAGDMSRNFRTEAVIEHLKIEALVVSFTSAALLTKSWQKSECSQIGLEGVERSCPLHQGRNCKVCQYFLLKGV